MQLNVKDNETDRLLMGTAFDIGLFFLAVVLLFLVAVMPSNSLASGAVPGEPVVWYSFYVSAPIAFLWISAFLQRRRRVLKGRGSSVLPEELSAIYSLVNGLIVIGIGGWLVYAGLNAFLDRGQQQTYYTHVLDKVVEEGGRFENFQLVLSSLKHEGGTLVLNVTSDFYDQVDAADSCLRLVVRPGAFGHEWIVENEPYKWPDMTADKDWQYHCRIAREQKIKLVDSFSSGLSRF